MPFTNPSYPGQIFKSLEEFNEARRKRQVVEETLTQREEEIVTVTATVIPAPKELLERKMVTLERKLLNLERRMVPETTENREGLEIGMTLRGESRGKEYTLDVLEEGYLCSDGNIYESLSGAALGVSENRRSGWQFWKDVAGTSIGEVAGRFEKNAAKSRLGP